MESEQEKRPIVLCLSGGGLRASFFHLGVLRCLMRLGLMDRITDIVSVSGGSILAAHLYLHWDSYSGSAEEFQKVQGIFLTLRTKDLRGRAVRRWFNWWPARLWNLFLGRIRHFKVTSSDFLEHDYRKFFGDSFLESMPLPSEQMLSKDTRRPRFHIMSTNLRTGKMVSFTQGAYVYGSGDNETVQAEMLHLYRAVAASSAFPPVFPPRDMSGDMLGLPTGSLDDDPHRLTDGGVYDNTGFEKAFELASSRADNPLIVISDAGSPFRSDPGEEYGTFLSLAQRSVDILMSRVASQIEKVLNTEHERKNVMVISIADAKTAIGKSGLKPETCRRLANIRTDLDTFSDAEVCSLMLHGESLAESMLSQFGQPGQKIEIPLALPPKDVAGLNEWDAVIRRGAVRKIWPLRLKDPFASLVCILWTLLIPTALIGAFTYVVYIVGFEKQINDVTGRNVELTTENNSLTDQLNAKQAALDQMQRALEAAESANTQKKTKQCSVQVSPARSSQVVRDSGWRGGGSNPNVWCNELATALKAENPEAEVVTHPLAEDSRDTCKPFNCRQYIYTCQATVSFPAVYRTIEAETCP